MKLSDLKGERAVEVIADLIAPIANIATDQDNLQLFKAKPKNGETAQEASVRDFKEKIPNLLKTHKKDILDILVAVNGGTPEKMTVTDIIKGALELANDGEFLNLFLSSVSPTGQTQPTESSAIAERTEPES